MPRQIQYYCWEIIERVDCSKDVILNNDELDIHIEKREYLNIMLKKRGDKKLVVIMMNPSKADSDNSDGTVDTIIDWFRNGSSDVNNDSSITGIKEITILNLFSIYNPKSTDLQFNIDQIIQYYQSYETLNKVLDSNLRTIEQYLIGSDYIVMGWGNSPSKFYATSYYKHIISVLEQLKKLGKQNLYVFHVRNNRARARGINSENILTGHKNPVHPSNGEIIGLIRVDIDNLLRILPREIVEGMNSR